MIQLMFIIVSVAAIVIFSEKHDLKTLNEFLDYAQDDMWSLFLWLGFAGLVLGMLLFTVCISKKINGR